MKEKSTKEKILEAALDMFSERGYDAVGVDEIAEAIGYTGPSIYRHFKGKEEILNTLIQEGNALFGSISSTPELIEQYSASYDALQEMLLNYTDLTLFHPKIAKLRRLCLMEQYRGAAFAKLTQDSPIHAMEVFLEPILVRMMEKGLILQCDPQIAALQLFAPIGASALFYDRDCGQREVILERIRRHLEQYRRLYEIK